MTDREILSNAIDKAIANGWHKGTGFEEGFTGSCTECGQTYMGIFSHSFLKAFFGEERIFYKLLEQTEHDRQVGLEGSEKHLHIETYGGRLEYYQVSAWQFHGQQMLLKENPIQYLSKFL